MKVHLMFPDRDAPVAPGALVARVWRMEPVRLGEEGAPEVVEDLVQDLQVDVVLDAMGGGDAMVREVCRETLLRPESDPEVVTWRQEILADCRVDPTIATSLRSLAQAGLDAEKDSWWVVSRRSPIPVDQSVRTLRAQLDRLERLRSETTPILHSAHSRGLRDLGRTLDTEVDDGWLADARHVLDVLSASGVVLATARLAPGGEVADPLPVVPEWTGRFRKRVRMQAPRVSFRIADRDESGFKSLEELRVRTLARVGAELEQAVTHIHSFFVHLRWESSFLIGCLTLEERLARAGVEQCVPRCLAPGGAHLHLDGVVDPGLALRGGAAPVPNDVDGQDRGLVVVTGANHGGKTTLLRAVGLVNLLASCGMRVPARGAEISLAPVVVTHWSREEEGGDGGGKLEGELVRLDRAVATMVPGALLLSNESFSSTDEAEATRIGLGVFRGLVGAGIRVVAVTHVVSLARELSSSGRPPAVFLRAQRGVGGTRPYRIVPGEPLRTSFAEDLWEKEFGYPLGGEVSGGGTGGGE